MGLAIIILAIGFLMAGIGGLIWYINKDNITQGYRITIIVLLMIGMSMIGFGLGAVLAGIINRKNFEDKKSKSNLIQQDGIIVPNKQNEESNSTQQDGIFVPNKQNEESNSTQQDGIFVPNKQNEGYNSTQQDQIKNKKSNLPLYRKSLPASSNLNQNLKEKRLSLQHNDNNDNNDNKSIKIMNYEDYVDYAKKNNFKILSRKEYNKNNLSSIHEFNINQLKNELDKKQPKLN